MARHTTIQSGARAGARCSESRWIHFAGVSALFAVRSEAGAIGRDVAGRPS
jgi:hypothetical protein